MNIHSISKENNKVIVELTSDELVKLCNILYLTEDENKNEIYYKLYSDLMIARDLSQYGHIDDFCMEQIQKCRENINKKDMFIEEDK